MNRRIKAATLFAVLTIISMCPVVSQIEEASAHAPHAPIFIDGNGDFTPDNGVTGGSGTVSDPYIIEGWEINASTGHGIEIRRTDAHFVIRDVNIHDGFYGDWPQYAGIHLWNVSNGSIEQSTFFNSQNNIDAIVVSNISIVNNTFYGVRDNETNPYCRHGVLVDWGENVTIANNWFTTIFQAAIWLTGWGTNVTIIKNYIMNSYWGITLIQFPTNVTVTENVLIDNDVGMYLIQPAGCHVYHNVFINNTQQGLDVQGFNDYWDDGYPNGGNYWSDYSGNDFLSGPDQDLPGSDGIGDTPYDVDVDTQDRYPLMSPVTPLPMRPPAILRATLSGTDLENVTIAWALSPDDGQGLKSVVGYEVYRGKVYDSSGLSYQFITALPNGTTTFTDASVGEGDQANYFYQVCAADVYHNQSCPETQVAKFTRPLSLGPNLISIPLIQSNESIEAILQTVKYDKVWSCNSSSQEWTWFMKQKEYRRGLWNMDHTQGIWVNVTEDSNLTVAGIVPTQTSIHLTAGWNLVSFPSFSTTYTVADLKAEIGAMRVEGYDLAPPYFLRTLGDAEVLLAGEAYWIEVDADVDWMVEGS
ncbi:MAG: right-handed parallel beta-helix repeat-containing protein [Thermoplasmata archaeon]|nr:right-handed parallel beta-helix repeat-containing protein [Thermoplasmata archaeon]